MVITWPWFHALDVDSTTLVAFLIIESCGISCGSMTMHNLLPTLEILDYYANEIE
jgi:hypothetical protein